MKKNLMLDFKIAKAIVEKQGLEGAGLSSLTFQETMLSNILEKAWAEFDNQLKDYVTKKLIGLEYQFATEDEFVEFLKSRVYSIGFQYRPFYNELYLDYVDSENKGIYLGSYSIKTDIFQKGDKVTITFG